MTASAVYGRTQTTGLRRYQPARGGGQDRPPEWDQTIRSLVGLPGVGLLGVKPPPKRSRYVPAVRLARALRLGKPDTALEAERLLREHGDALLASLGFPAVAVVHHIDDPLPPGAPHRSGDPARFNKRLLCWMEPLDPLDHLGLRVAVLSRCAGHLFQARRLPHFDSQVLKTGVILFDPAAVAACRRVGGAR